MLSLEMSTSIDLHLHSSYSDGRQSPQEVVKTAADHGVKFLAMADHESTNSFMEVKQAAKKAKVQVIPAMEITTNYEGSVLHILGYNFDPKNKLMQQLSQVLLHNREQKVVERMQHLAQHAKLKGRLNVKDFIRSQNGFFNRWKAVDYLVEQKLVKNRFEALRHLAGIKIAVPDISPQIAIQLVHQAGGIAVLAHPFGPEISLSHLTKDAKKQNAALSELKEQGLDGIECYQPSHNVQETKRALAVAKKFGWIISAGSDWHGPLRLTGKGILEYIPNYVSAPGQFDVPPDVQKQMIETFFK